MTRDIQSFVDKQKRLRKTKSKDSIKSTDILMRNKLKDCKCDEHSLRLERMSMRKKFEVVVNPSSMKYLRIIDKLKDKVSRIKAAIIILKKRNQKGQFSLKQMGSVLQKDSEIMNTFKWGNLKVHRREEKVTSQKT